MSPPLQGVESLLLIERALISTSIGGVIGLERGSIGKPLGVRAFAGIALTATLAWSLSPGFAYGVLGALVVFAVGLNIMSLQRDRSLEMTTSVAILITGLLGIVVAEDQWLVAGVCAAAVALLLLWKGPLTTFAGAVSVEEIRGGLIVGMIGLVVYPLLPAGEIDPWHLIDVRDAWVGVLAISGIGFLNYILLRLWGTRGVVWAGLLGGFVNSRAVAVEMATRARAQPNLWPFAISGILTANVAMLVRNAFVLTAIAIQTWRWGAIPFTSMLATGAILALVVRRHARSRAAFSPGIPVSLRHVLTFGLIFLVIGVLAQAAERVLGHTGFLLVAFVGGLVSSASTVVAAAVLAGQGKVPPNIAAYAVVLASMTTLLSNLPAVQIAGRDRAATKRLALFSYLTVGAGLVGLCITALRGV